MSENPWAMWKEAAITCEPVKHQLSLMWRTYGRRESQVCGTCAQLYKRKGNTKYYFKCKLYGDTCGEGTDWRKKWLACGRWERKDD
jgi:hypothetical protein